MKVELESLQKLREKNRKYSETGLFGIKMESAYLKTSGSQSGIMEKRNNLKFQQSKNQIKSPQHYLS